MSSPSVSLTGLQSVGLSLINPAATISLLRKHNDLVSVCWFLIVLRCFLEFPATWYSWYQLPSELNGMFWFMQVIYWIGTHPVAMFVEVLMATAVYFLMVPEIWRRIYLKEGEAPAIYVALAYLFSVMAIVGPLFRLAYHSFPVAWFYIEMLIVTLLMGLAVRLVFRWTWTRAIWASFVVEIVWVGCIVSLYLIFLILPIVATAVMT